MYRWCCCSFRPQQVHLNGWRGSSSSKARRKGSSSQLPSLPSYHSYSTRQVDFFNRIPDAFRLFFYLSLFTAFKRQLNSLVAQPGLFPLSVAPCSLHRSTSASARPLRDSEAPLREALRWTLQEEKHGNGRRLMFARVRSPSPSFPLSLFQPGTDLVDMQINKFLLKRLSKRNLFGITGTQKESD